MKIHPLVTGTAMVLNLTCLAIGGFFALDVKLKSLAIDNRRNQRLEIVAKHKLSDTCLTVPADRKFKTPNIGETIDIENPVGTISTSCIDDKSSNTVLFVAYENTTLKIQDVFSQKEIESKISQLKTGKNDNQ